MNAVNVFFGAGYAVRDAELFTTRTGRPKVTVRVAFPRDPSLPWKEPSGGDYYTVVGLGERFVPLVSHLQQGTPVVVFGYAQSRDVEVRGEERTVSEIGAQAIYVVREVRNDDEDDGD
jgi:single-stranded DNA-binding protein